MLNEKQEEIIEAIYTSGETENYSIDAFRKRCCVDFGDSDLEGLEHLGLIIRNEDRVLFSNQGKKIGEKIIRRHRLAEMLLSSILKLKNSKMEEFACQIEHYLHPEVEESICILLGHPEICPDGKPIPKGRCCDRGVSIINQAVHSLVELGSGEQGKITYIRPGNHSNLHQLLSFGLNPGVTVSVHRTSPAFCIKYENTELALDKEIAANIFVWRITK